MKVRQSHEFMASSMKLKGGIKFLCGKHSTMHSITCH